MTHHHLPRVLSLAAILILTAAGAAANPIVITPYDFVLSGVPGSSVQVIVRVENSTDATVFLNAISTSGLGGLSGSPFDLTPFATDSSVPFFFEAFNQPGYLAPAAHLFDILIPLDALPGFYPGGFELQGGANDLSFDAIASATFTLEVTGIQAVPEPSAVLLAAPALLALAFFRRYPRRS